MELLNQEKKKQLALKYNKDYVSEPQFRLDPLLFTAENPVGVWCEGMDRIYGIERMAENPNHVFILLNSGWGRGRMDMLSYRNGDYTFWRIKKLHRDTLNLNN